MLIARDTTAGGTNIDVSVHRLPVVNVSPLLQSTPKSAAISPDLHRIDRVVAGVNTGNECYYIPELRVMVMARTGLPLFLPFHQHAFSQDAERAPSLSRCLRSKRCHLQSETHSCEPVPPRTNSNSYTRSPLRKQPWYTLMYVSWPNRPSSSLKANATNFFGSSSIAWHARSASK